MNIDFLKKLTEFYEYMVAKKTRTFALGVILTLILGSFVYKLSEARKKDLQEIIDSERVRVKECREQIHETEKELDLSKQEFKRLALKMETYHQDEDSKCFKKFTNTINFMNQLKSKVKTEEVKMNDKKNKLNKLK